MCKVEPEWECYSNSSTTPDACLKVIDFTFVKASDSLFLLTFTSPFDAPIGSTMFQNSFSFSLQDGTQLLSGSDYAITYNGASALAISFYLTTTKYHPSLFINAVIINSDQLYSQTNHRFVSNSRNLTTSLGNATATPTPDYSYSSLLSESAEKMADATDIANKVIMGAAVAPMLLQGSPNIFMKQISIVQTLMVLLFYSIDYPINFENFLSIFKISKMDFLPNLFKLFISDFDE